MRYNRIHWSVICKLSYNELNNLFFTSMSLLRVRQLKPDHVAVLSPIFGNISLDAKHLEQ